MTEPKPQIVAEAATATHIGARKRQEDAVLADFSRGSDLGLAVLSDGMGGHDDGDLASRIIVSEMFGELFYSGARLDALQSAAPDTLRHALHAANRSLVRHANSGCISADTGGTLVTVALIGHHLRWISVGDSPLYLYRDGALHRLNEIHSLGAQIDMMVRCGEIDAADAQDHPQRHQLTSALTGRDIRHIDCPEAALHLKQDDVVVLASDGLNVLADQQICDLIRRYRHKPSQRIAAALMANVEAQRNPDQDNASLIVIKMEPARPKSFWQRLPGHVFGGCERLAERSALPQRMPVRPVTEGPRA